jgi:hypothetical protein
MRKKKRRQAAMRNEHKKLAHEIEAPFAKTPAH